MGRHEAAWYTALVATIITILLTLHQIRTHLRWNTHPRMRKLVIRIIAMAPIYAFESWLGLKYYHWSLYFAFLRECYEAFVIYSFYLLLVTYLGGEAGTHRVMAEKTEATQHMLPFCFLTPWSHVPEEDGVSEFALNTQLGTLQYCVVKPIVAAISFFLSIFDRYGDGELDWSKGYPYMAFINNASQIWAMYCLILFYMSTKDALKPLRPVPKFLVVKLVVFFTFWQSILLAILSKLGAFEATEHFTEEHIVMGLQDFIVCLEMVIAAVAHMSAFDYKDFHDPSQPLISTPMFRSLFEVANVSDVYVSDVQHIRAKVNRQRQTANVPIRGSNYEPLPEYTYDVSISSSLSRSVSSSAQLASPPLSASPSPYSPPTVPSPPPPSLASSSPSFQSPPLVAKRVVAVHISSVSSPNISSSPQPTSEPFALPNSASSSSSASSPSITTTTTTTTTTIEEELSFSLPPPGTEMELAPTKPQPIVEEP